ncbi:hypothetical protein BS17DRAFT_766180 [Gyrodon lividus]|nr:hypothetical protein BS17DRAFT_766180 [Gyrodon lividus]
MGSPLNGNVTVQIVSAVEPFLPIGADNDDNSAVKRVVSDGEMRKWFLSEVEPGKWKIVLDKNWYGTEEKGSDNVFVQTSVDPGTRWVIKQFRDDLYTIERDAPIFPNKAWTLAGDEPKAEVVLRPILAQPLPHQLWRFQAVLDD